MVQFDYVVTKSAKPSLAIPTATVHEHHGEILCAGDTSLIFIYEK